MGQPFVGEIRMVGFNFAPVNWSFCNGATISIAQNEVLFQLIGTTYGGDGVTTYNLPDLRGRIPVHQGSNFVIGQLSGSETVTLASNQIPIHTHLAQANDNTTGAAANNPSGGYWNKWSGSGFSTSANTPSDVLNPATIGSAGNSQPHDNMPPFLAINFIISLFGIFPTQN